MRILFVTLVTAALLAPVTVRAQAPLDVSVEADDVDSAAFVDALAQYLGRPVALRGHAGRLRVERVADATLRLSYVGDDGLARTRDTLATPDRTETSRALALLASNLVRDESTALLALLRARATPPTALAAPHVASPAPAPAPAPLVVAGVDFAPALGTSSAWLGREQRAFSFGAVGALSGGVDGFALSGVTDLAIGGVHGLQIAGVFALAARELAGVQLSLVGVAGTSAEGLQLALVTLAGEDLRGVQLGLVDVAGRNAVGLQLGLVDVAGGDAEGMQLGLVNVAGGRVHGVQLGLVNVADDADAAIGLVSVTAKGRTQLRLGVDTSGTIGAEVLFGQRFTHSILVARAAPFLLRPAAVVGVGIGGRIALSDDVHFDVDGLSQVILDSEAGQVGPDFLLALRVVLGVRVSGALGLYAGLSYELLVSESATSDYQAPLLVDTLHDVQPTLRGWPSLCAGVELF